MMSDQMQRLLAAAGWDARSIRHQQLEDALAAAGLQLADVAKPPCEQPPAKSRDLLGVMAHGHACPIANEKYAWAVAEITGLRKKVSELIDEASHADLRASGGIVGAP